jgi:FHA domain/Double zinc ribbon
MRGIVMPNCNICGEAIPDGSRTCSVCGSQVDDFVPAAPVRTAFGAPTIPADLPVGSGWCPVCGTIYGPDHTDNFCACGTELLRHPSAPPAAASVPTAAIVEELPPLAPIVEELPPMAPLIEEPTTAPIIEDVPLAPIMDAAASVETAAAEEEHAPAVKVRSVKPSPGTPCLVLYGPDKQPLQYFALAKDATLIGRLDAVKGVFPDVDLDEWFDRATIRKISRQHALILRTRATSTFALRPLAGNTGTQLETQMLQPLQDYPLRPGHRIILGGVIRLKFEVA